MTNQTIPPYNPDEEARAVQPQPQQAQAQAQRAPMQTAPVQSAPRPNQEVKTIDEHTMIKLDGSDEMPKFPPVPNGDYDVVIDSVKSHYSQAGNYTINVTLKVISPPAFIDKLIFLTIVPGTEFGDIRFTQLIKRSLTTNAQMQTISLFERMGQMNYGDFVASAIAINARTRVTTKQGINKLTGDTVANITNIQLPSTNSFM
jgi:hypothetical protein